MPIADDALLSESDEARVFDCKSEIAIILNITNVVSNHIDDFHHVFADELEDEWRHPVLRGREKLWYLPLALESVVVPTQQTSQDQLLGITQCTYHLRFGRLRVDSERNVKGIPTEGDRANIVLRRR